MRVGTILSLSPAPAGERARVRGDSSPCRTRRVPSLPMDALTFRRRLRRQPTDAERRLWNALRARRFAGKFRRQHSLGPYVLDLYCADARLAIEADGGGHYSENGQAADASRDAFLASQGVRVLRFTDRQIMTETAMVLEDVWEAIQGARGRAPSP